MNPKQRGLGRGLDALFGDEEGGYRLAAGNDDSGDTIGSAGGSRLSVNIGQIQPNPEQPRQVFDETALEELAASIREHGLLQPILVRPHRRDPEAYEIVAGERRWRAAQRAQLHEVPIVVRDLDDSTALQIALIENLQRQDLNPIEESKGYQKLIDEFGHSSDSLAETLGKSRSHVANMVRLLQLPGSVQTMVSSGDLSAGHARALIKADNPALLAQEVVARGLSVRQTEKLAAEAAGRDVKRQSGRRSSGNGPAKDTDTLALENEISQVLGMRVVISMRDTQAGTLSIDFRDLDQLDEVLHRLSQR